MEQERHRTELERQHAVPPALATPPPTKPRTSPPERKIEDEYDELIARLKDVLAKGNPQRVSSFRETIQDIIKGQGKQIGVGQHSIWALVTWNPSRC